MWGFCVKSLAWLCKNSEVWFMIKFKINLCRIIPEVFVFASDGITVIPFAPFFSSLKQFPKNGELILRRLVLLFRRAYRRNAKVGLYASCWYLLKENRTDSNNSHNNSLPIPSSSSLFFLLLLLLLLLLYLLYLLYLVPKIEPPQNWSNPLTCLVLIQIVYLLSQPVCLSASRFIAHLVNQQVVSSNYELLH